MASALSRCAARIVARSRKRRPGAELGRTAVEPKLVPDPAAQTVNFGGSRGTKSTDIVLNATPALLPSLTADDRALRSRHMSAARRAARSARATVRIGRRRIRSRRLTRAFYPQVRSCARVKFSKRGFRAIKRAFLRHIRVFMRS
jgi:hypothetical protein